MPCAVHGSILSDDATEIPIANSVSRSCSGETTLFMLCDKIGLFRILSYQLAVGYNSSSNESASIIADLVIRRPLPRRGVDHWVTSAGRSCLKGYDPVARASLIVKPYTGFWPKTLSVCRSGVTGSPARAAQNKKWICTVISPTDCPALPYLLWAYRVPPSLQSYKVYRVYKVCSNQGVPSDTE